MWNTACASVRRLCVDRRCLTETASQLSTLKMTQQGQFLKQKWTRQRRRDTTGTATSTHPTRTAAERVGTHYNQQCGVMETCASSYGGPATLIPVHPPVYSLFQFSVPDTSFCLRLATAFTL